MSLTFGQYIARKRKDLGLSQKELARQISKEDDSSISPQYLNDIERDRRNPPGDPILRQFARVLHIDEDFLWYLADGLPTDTKKLSDDPDRVARAFRAFRRTLGGSS